VNRPHKHFAWFGLKVRFRHEGKKSKTEAMQHVHLILKEDE
jgi:hypothetical protein